MGWVITHRCVDEDRKQTRFGSPVYTIVNGWTFCTSGSGILYHEVVRAERDLEAISKCFPYVEYTLVEWPEEMEYLLTGEYGRKSEKP